MESETKTAFVTGGTGFVGSHLVEELLRRGYDDVRCLVRSEPKWLAEMDVEYVHGDLSDVEALWEAVRGVDYVYHVAGVTRAKGWDAFYAANVQATLNLMGAIREANPALRRVLVTSSLAAVGRCKEKIATEATPLNPISLYGRSKAEMERALRERHDMSASYAEALPLTIVRPPAVYGPRDRDILTFFRTVKKGICPVVGSGKTQALSLVHVRDLVRGMVDAAESEAAEGETYFLGSDRTYSWDDVKAAATKALGRRALTVPVPGVLVETVGAVTEWWGDRLGVHPPLNRDKAREIRHACKICSVQKARKDFGYVQRVSLEEGVKKTVTWYENKGWL